MALGDDIRRNIASVDPTERVLLRESVKDTSDAASTNASAAAVVTDNAASAMDLATQAFEAVAETGNLLSGLGTPEGILAASVGTIYSDTSKGDLYVKHVGAGNTGWQRERPYLDAVRDFAADNTGATDATAALQAAMDLTDGSDIYVPAGTYKVNATGLLLRKKNLRIRGAGRGRTVLLATASNTSVFGCTASSGAPVFEDFTVDGNGIFCHAFCILQGQFLEGITVRRLSIQRLGGGRGMWLGGARHGLVEDVEFDGYGKCTDDGILLSEACQDWTIRGCRFIAVANGVTISPNGPLQCRGFRIYDNCFDGAYYNAPAKFMGSGSTVTYATGTLTDTARDWGVEANEHHGYIRAMVPRATGLVGSGDSYNTPCQLTASSGPDFTATAGIFEGCIVYTSDGRMGMVTAVATASKINLEEWLDKATYRPTTPPAVGATYTVYEPYLSYMDARGSPAGTFTIGVAFRKIDVDADDIIPPAGTLYETVPFGNYAGIHIGRGAVDIQVRGNTVKRPYSDGISVFSKDCIVVANEVVWYQDTGITATGMDHGTITGNRLYKCGSNGIYLAGEGITCVGNTITAHGYRGNGIGVARTSSGGIIVDGVRCVVTGNVIDPQGGYRGRDGIFVRNHGNKVANNQYINWPGDEWQPRKVWVVGSPAITGCVFDEDERVYTCTVNGDPAQLAGNQLVRTFLKDLSTPNGYVAGVVGSTAVTASGGTANLWLKKSAASTNDVTGWELVSTTPPALDPIALNGAALIELWQPDDNDLYRTIVDVGGGIYEISRCAGRKNGYHADAPLAANRPRYLRSNPAIRGRPSIQFHDVQKFLRTSLFAPVEQPVTWYVAWKTPAFSAGSPDRYVVGGSGGGAGATGHYVGTNSSARQASSGVVQQSAYSPDTAAGNTWTIWMITFAADGLGWKERTIFEYIDRATGGPYALNGATFGADGLTGNFNPVGGELACAYAVARDDRLVANDAIRKSNFEMLSAATGINVLLEAP